MTTIELSNRLMTLAYDEAGSGLPVVLLHAFPFEHSMWSPQLGPIAAAGYRVIALDLPEFGDSTGGVEPLSIDLAADVVAEFLDILEIPQAVVGGISMGGYVAMAFARRHPQRLAGLILADTRSSPDDDAAKSRRNELIQAIQASGPVAVAEALLPRLFSERTRKHNPEVIRRLREIVLRQRSNGLIAGLVALRDRPDAAPGLAAVAVPTLVLVGEHDGVTPPLMSVRIAGCIRASELVHIPDAGHLSNAENPGMFNSAVLTFLQKLNR